MFTYVRMYTNIYVSTKVLSPKFCVQVLLCPKKYCVESFVSKEVLCRKYCVHQSIEDALHSHCVHRCPTQIGAADTRLYAPLLLFLVIFL